MNFFQAEVVDAGNGAFTAQLVNQGGVRLTRALSGALPARGDKVTIGVRPEHFGPPGAGIADIDLRIDVAEHLGSTTYIYANTAAGEQVIVEREERRAGDGDSLTVAIPADKALVFDSAGNRLR